MRPEAYGDAFADVYDEWYADVSDVDATVALVAQLAGGRPVLELGIGTGRIALPLRERGLDVEGVDASSAMVEQLRAKPGGAGLQVLVADFAERLPTRPGGYGVALAAFNTLLNLPTEAAQRRCLQLVADALTSGGAFVVEAIVPDTDPPPSGVSVRRTAGGDVVLTMFLRRPSTRRVSGQLVSFGADGVVRARPWSVLPTTPERLDELADEAGFTCERRTFDDAHTAHVTVYRKSGGTVRSVGVR